MRWRLGSLDVCTYAYEYRYRLEELWKKPPETAIPQVEPTTNALAPADDGIRLSRTRPAPLDWKLAFTGVFSKAIATADRSLQGRVLLALSEISSDPVTPRGDTVKRLTSDKQGLWRYRVGDYRLVYEPLPEDKLVVLVDFAPRGGVYE